ncbi:MAG: PorV/PorQ family protein [Fibrobacterales bacterium]
MILIKKIIASLLFLTSLIHAAGQGSAIITLSLPVGARQLGMGESGIALPDDAFATYWNPAGLAFAPLADEWKVSLDQPLAINAASHITSNINTGFFQHSELWLGGPEGLKHFNGMQWVDYHVQELHQGNTLRKVVRDFIGTNNDLSQILLKVREINNIYSPEEERLLTQVKLPWSLVIKDSVTAIHFNSKKSTVWVGTTQGLFKFDGNKWQNYETSLGKLKITALSVHEYSTWVGTHNGLYKLRYSKFKRMGKVLPSQDITALAYSPERNELYASVKGAGVARLTEQKVSRGRAAPKVKHKWNLYNLEDGLIDLDPRQIAIDSLGEVWVAHESGVSRFTLKKWEQILFEKNKVHTVTIGPHNSIWIGTDKGVWQHFPERFLVKKKSLLKPESNGDWKHYHAFNGLHSNQVYDIISEGKELWLITGAGVEQFQTSEIQVGFYYEQLLQALGIADLWHVYTTATIPLGDWGTLGVSLHHASLGVTETTDGFNSVRSSYKSTESVLGLSYGTKLSALTSLGLNFKTFYSDLSSGANEVGNAATSAGYAVDISYLAKDLLIPTLNFGLGLFNMGPAVYYNKPNNTDPLPLTWRIGLAYEIINIAEHRLQATMDYDRTTLSYNDTGEPDPFYISAWKAWFYPDQFDNVTNTQLENSNWDTFKQSVKEGIFKTGVEYTYQNMFAVRSGYMVDPSGDREELDIGIGVMISDFFQVDYGRIQDLSGNNVRNNQGRFSLLLRF